MESSEISGLVLTHESRDPSALLYQLAGLCREIVVVQDARYGNFDPMLNSSHGCEMVVIEREFDTFPKQRNAGIEEASGRWILSIDSDELLSKELVSEIKVLQPPEDAQIYGMPKRERIRKRELKVANPMGMLKPLHPRLFRSNLRYSEDTLVHETLEDQSHHGVLPLSGNIEHLVHEGTFQLWQKYYEYGRLRAASVGSGEKTAGEYAKAVRVLSRFIARDGFAGLGMAGARIAFEIGSRRARS